MKKSTSLIPGSTLDPLAVWLLGSGSRGLGCEELLAQLASKVGEHGIDVWRIVVSIPTAHPEVYVRNIEWSKRTGSLVRLRRRDVVETLGYLLSPVADIHKGSGPIRCRLEGLTEFPYPICKEVAEQGGTDYIALPLVFSDGRRSFVSWATDRAGGFRDEDIAMLEEMVPYLALRFELESAYFTMRCLLEVYLGGNAAERVMAGAFRRGEGESIRAAIWFCDMRNFTVMADTRPAVEVVATLDRFFEAVAGPIRSHGGEILKFIGDAVLAIFPVREDGAEVVCRNALAAAENAVTAISAMNAESGGEDGNAPPIALGIALHLGDVMYGNIGAEDRLDFTVIGAAVNEVCRVESLCKTVDAPLLMTKSFAEACGDARSTSVGMHALKGVHEPQEIFTLQDFVRA